MAKVRGLDSSEVRRAFLLSGGDVAATARLFNVSRQTIHHHLRTAPPLIIPAVNLPGATDDSPDSIAVRTYVRFMLSRAGVLKEPPEA